VSTNGSSRPLLGLAAWYAAGAALGGELGIGAAWGLVGCATLSLLAAWWGAGRPGAARAGLLAAALALGAAAAAVERFDHETAGAAGLAREAPEAPLRLLGTLVADVEEQTDNRVLLLQLESVRRGGVDRAYRGRARVRVYGSAEMPEIHQGDRVAVWARVHAPRSWWVWGGWDAAAHALRRGVHISGTCKSPLLVARADPQPVPGPAVWAARARARAREALERHVPPGPEQGLVRAMVLGDRTGVGEEAAEDFRIAGTYHVLALSGAQVALVAGLLLWASHRLRLRPFARAALVCGAVCFYAQFVGGDVPVVRAALMAGILVSGRAFDLDGDLANLLGFAALALLIYRPSWVGDVGFQLSFGATLGILLIGPVLVQRIRRLPLRLELALAASLAAQAALVPLLMAQFNRLAPAAVLMNLVAAPLASAVLLAGFCSVGLASVSAALAGWAGDVAWLAAHTLLSSGEWVRDNPWLDVRTSVPGLVPAVLYTAGLFGVADERRRPRALVPLIAGSLLLAFGPAPRVADGRLHLVVLDVGHGDSLVLHSPRGRTAVIDAGVRRAGFDVGDRVVAPYLHWSGVRRLDFLALTHAHWDHVGGAPALLRGFGVGQVWEGPAPTRSRRYQEMSRALGGATRLSVRRGARVEWDGVRITVEGPPPGPPPRTVRNDDSLVLGVELGAVRLLLTGDVSRDAERLVRFGPAAVLKVPHHGSRTSSSVGFLARVRPELAVVSAGSRRFGHPHPEVLERYRKAGVRLFRTDLDGSVAISTDGERIWVESVGGARETWRSGL
jgi:competence protein ComEC